MILQFGRFLTIQRKKGYTWNLNFAEIVLDSVPAASDSVPTTEVSLRIRQRGHWIWKVSWNRKWQNPLLWPKTWWTGGTEWPFRCSDQFEFLQVYLLQGHHKKSKPLTADQCPANFPWAYNEVPHCSATKMLNVPGKYSIPIESSPTQYQIRHPNYRRNPCKYQILFNMVVCRLQNCIDTKNFKWGGK